MHRGRNAELKALLGIPESIVPAAAIPMGYPRGRFGAGLHKPLEAVTFFEPWGAAPPW
jgi:hypothetical protein